MSQVSTDRQTAIWAALAYLAFSAFVPLIPVHPHRLNIVFVLALLVVPTALFMLLQLWVGRAFVCLRPRPIPCVLAAGVAALVWLLVFLWVHPYRGLTGPVNGWLFLLRSLLVNLSITVACTFFGILLSRIVREPNVLLPVALVAMPIDYIGAMTPIGFTQNAEHHHPAIVQAVSVSVPTVGGLHPISFIGPGDALFVAFFLAVVLRLDLNLRGTFWTMYILLTVTMLLVLFTGLPIAALVPMGLAVLLANGMRMHLQRSEVFATIYAIALVLTLVVAFYWYSHTHIFHH